MEKISKTKICKNCNTEKSEEYFLKGRRLCKPCGREVNKLQRKIYRHNNSEKIKEQQRRYQEKNKKEIAEKKRQYEIKNKEKIAERKRQYHIDNREKIIETFRIWRIENPEKNRERVKKYKQSEKGRLSNKNSNHKRRTKLKQGDVTNEQLQELINNSKKCYWCGVKLNKDYHIDHYVPLSKGGEHTISNLVISCPDCNLKKNNKDPQEFAQHLGKLL